MLTISAHPWEVMGKEEIQAAIPAIQNDLTAVPQSAWRKHVARHFTDIEFHAHDDVTSAPNMPSPVLYMRMRRQRGFLGLGGRDFLIVDLSAEWHESENDVFLHTLGLAMQGKRFLSQQSKKERYTRQLRGPKADMASMRTLLKADIFATLLQHGAGDKNAVRKAVRRRAEALLTARHCADPSLFALPMACDTINVVLPTLAGPVQTMDRYFFQEMLARAEDVSRCVDAQILSDWYGFGQAAQDMAWRGASKRQILGAALMADAPHIRTIATMISELTGLVGHTPDEFTSAYSSFTDIDGNSRAHSFAMEQEFEWAMSQDPLVHGSKVFLQAADRQIANLQKGQVVGWCADALQNSAKAFDDHGAADKDALIAARRAFDDSKNGNSWDNLNRIGEIIVDRCRKGVLTSLRDLREIASQTGLNGMQNAIESHILLTSAPQSSHTLEHAFKGPTIRGPQPVEPVMAPSAPRLISIPVPAGPGGGTHMQTVPLVVPREQDEQSSAE